MFAKFNLKSLFSLPAKLVIVIFTVVFFGKYFPLNVVRSLYTFSFIFKEVLGLFLPIMVFAFILGGFLAYKKKAPVILFFLLLFIIISNFIVGTVSFLTGSVFLDVLTSGVNHNDLIAGTVMLPWFSINIPQPFTADKVILIALVLGAIFSFINYPPFDNFIMKLKKWVEIILLKGFIPFLPIYVLGFLLKMFFEGTFSAMFGAFGLTFLVILSLQVVYLIVMYIVAAGFNIKLAFRYIQNALPSYVTAFSTMSSVVAIPVTVESSVKNTGNRRLSTLATPILANAHLLGDAMTVPILSVVAVSMFNMGNIPLLVFLKFLFYFCLTMLAAAGVPGGGIMVMIPILESILGFNNGMISVITTLYLIQDSFGTSCNVMGDGALTIMLNKFLNFFGISKD